MARIEHFTTYKVLVLHLLLQFALGSCPSPPVCTICNSGQAVCKLCPEDPNIPSTVKNLKILAGGCTQLSRLGLLRTNSFSRYTNLEKLDLNESGVQRFFGAVFEKNVNLKILLMAKNNFRSFTASTFQGLSKLEELNMAESGTTALIPSSFVNLPSLKNLNLSGNKYQKLSEHDLDGLSNLQQLSLSNNPITTIESATFQPLVKVEVIEMNDMELTSFSSQLFLGLSSLKEIHASDNKISVIAADSLVGTSLDILDLSNNQLTNVPSDAIKRTKTPPKKLDLSENKITTISSGASKTITIETLDLHSNSLVTVQGGAFNESVISNLDLSNNNLKALPSSMESWLNNGHTKLNLEGNTQWTCDCNTLWLGRYLLANPTSKGPTCGTNSKYAGNKLAASMAQLETDCKNTCPAPPICSVCNRVEAVCKLCPEDSDIPSSVKNLKILAGGCTQLSRLGLLRTNSFSRYTNLEKLDLNESGVQRFFGAVFEKNVNMKILLMAKNNIRSFTASTFQGLSKLEELNMAESGTTALIPSSFVNLPSLKNLNLSGNKYQKLSEHDLDGLGNVQNLYISNNPITTIESATFQPLDKVEVIEMKDMELTSFSSQLFSGLSRLKEIHASDNKISVIAVDSLAGTSLDLLDLSNNQLTNVPSDAVKQSKTPPKKLDLSENKITTISSGAFKTITIETLDLHSNSLVTVQDGAFNESVITNLDLSNNNLKALPNSMESWLKNGHTKLNLEGNTQWTCDCNTLWLGRYLLANPASKGPTCGTNSKYAGNKLTASMPQLETDCKNTCPAPPICSVCNRVEAVCKLCPEDSDIPSSVTDLQIIAGGCSQLRQLGLLRSNSFSRYTALERLNLTEAGVQRFYGTVFANNVNLKSLWMSNNKIRSFSSVTFQGLSHLEELNMADSTIRALIPSSFKDLTSLKDLDLSGNNLQELHEHDFDDLSNLQHLSLSNNPITTIESATFQPLVKVEVIEMKDMELTSFSSQLFSGLSSLKEIHASGNKINVIAGDSLAGTSLDILDLSNNQLTNVPSDAIKQAKTPPILLDLSQNKISTISAFDFKDLTIDSLNLHGNPIDQIEDNAFAQSIISNLDLSNTHLKSLPGSMESWLTSGHTNLTLEGNTQWICDCNTLWLGRYLLASPSSKSPTCDLSTKYGGHLLSDSMTKLEEDCKPTTTTSTTTTTTTTTSTTTTPKPITTTPTTTEETTTNIPTTSTTKPTTTTTRKTTTQPTATTTTTTIMKTTPPTSPPQTPTTTQLPVTTKSNSLTPQEEDCMINPFTIILAALCTLAFCLSCIGIMSACLVCKKQREQENKIHNSPPKVGWITPFKHFNRY